MTLLRTFTDKSVRLRLFWFSKLTVMTISLRGSTNGGISTVPRKAGMYVVALGEPVTSMYNNAFLSWLLPVRLM